MTDTNDNEESEEWFNQKFANGDMPALEDKMELFENEPPIDLPKRARKEIERRIKEALYRLNHQYTPAREVKAYHYVTCISICAGLDREARMHYRQQFTTIMKKHKNQSPFHKNYTE